MDTIERQGEPIDSAALWQQKRRNKTTFCRFSYCVTLNDPKMSKRDSSSDISSNIGLDSVTLNRSRPLPEEWTLPTEWNIEQREIYENWKLDLQSQIKNIDMQLAQSLGEYPTEALGPYYNLHSPLDAESIRRIRLDMLSGKMQKGLMRK